MAYFMAEYVPVSEDIDVFIQSLSNFRDVIGVQIICEVDGQVGTIAWDDFKKNVDGEESNGIVPKSHPSNVQLNFFLTPDTTEYLRRYAKGADVIPFVNHIYIVCDGEVLGYWNDVLDGPFMICATIAVDWDKNISDDEP